MHKDDSDRLEKWAATSLTSVLALLLTLTLCAPTAVAQSSTAFHANGAFAIAVNCLESQPALECIFVAPSREVTNGQTTTFLFYDHFTQNLTTGAFVDSFGSGQIPNSAFQVSTKADSLNVDTSTVAGFTNEVCTFDPNTNLTNCENSAGGIVTGAWSLLTNLIRLHNTGTSTFTAPGVKFISTGTSEAKAAVANVDVLGTVMMNIGGSIGTNHNTLITVLH